MSEEKIGMYTAEEILEFMTDGEGRGFMGRSMFDAMYFKIKDLQQKVEQLENIRKEAIAFILDGRYGEDDDLESISLYMPDLLNILNKGDNNGK